MSLPNCCSVVRKRFSLQSCRAPQAGGSCWLESEAVDDIAGPLLKPLGVDGAPFSDVGEWLLPFSTADKQTRGRRACCSDLWVEGLNTYGLTHVIPTGSTCVPALERAGGGGGMVGGVDLGWVFTSAVQTAGLTASDKCSWICCCPSLDSPQSSVLLPEASLSSASHPTSTKQGKARLWRLLWLAARPPAFPHLFPIRPLRSPHKQSLSPWPPASHQAFVSKHGNCSPVPWTQDLGIQDPQNPPLGLCVRGVEHLNINNCHVGHLGPHSQLAPWAHSHHQHSCHRAREMWGRNSDNRATLEAEWRSKTGDKSFRCLISSALTTSDITSCSDHFDMDTEQCLRRCIQETVAGAHFLCDSQLVLEAAEINTSYSSGTRADYGTPPQKQSERWKEESDCRPITC
ncbi:hypothetical protein EYF80_009237 [Liparis tanakae]|uniref:Uncharacterized protein n=1 Tax=Liparis tanakae TaxID=230148 RepID=A0A4Z2ISB7_9TELE|nr:hypothetical protein EYF80_009237 [Liparis tanakae]